MLTTYLDDIGSTALLNWENLLIGLGIIFSLIILFKIIKVFIKYIFWIIATIIITAVIYVLIIKGWLW